MGHTSKKKKKEKEKVMCQWYIYLVCPSFMLRSCESQIVEVEYDHVSYEEDSIFDGQKVIFFFFMIVNPCHCLSIIKKKNKETFFKNVIFIIFFSFLHRNGLVSN